METPTAAPGTQPEPQPEAAEREAAQREELRQTALASLRGRYLTGVFLVATFGGSHPHVEPLAEDPAPVRLAVTAIVRTGELLADRPWVFAAVAVALLVIAQRRWLSRLERPALVRLARIVWIAVAVAFVALHVPLYRVLRGGL